ncbi:MAG: hypothetical protein ACI9UA_000874 [Pseudoalteromonas tetraodonis]|jgi:hypothetical protein
MHSSLALSLIALSLASQLHAQDSIPLIKAKDSEKVWSFNNGAEFPGATGSLESIPDAGKNGTASLKLVGDFTGGGGYVQAGRNIPDVDIRELSMWVKCPGIEKFTLRLNDSSGQTHQINLKAEKSADWQRIDLPLERFFARRGQADAVTSIAKYESWGGAKDGNWHGPAKAIYLLLGNEGTNQVRTLWLSDVTIVSKPKPVAEIKSSVPIGALEDWNFSNGAEFAGAKGSLTLAHGKHLKLAGDFTGGGAYVAAVRNLERLQTKQAPLLKMRTKTSNAKSVSLQLVDGSGQTHQQKGVLIKADGEWHDLTIQPEKIVGGEHWGGANDGKWHGGIRLIAISVTSGSGVATKRPELLLSDIHAEVLMPVFAQKAAMQEGFDDEELDDWKVSKGVEVQTGALVLKRSLNEIAQHLSASSPKFDATSGQWQVALKCRADLHSPDNSYNAVVQVECLDQSGKVIERIPVAEVFGKRDWKEVERLVDLPEGTVNARVHTQLNKSYGKFEIDDIKVSYLAPKLRRDERISRLLFSTARLGNLLFPEDSRIVDVRVEARKALRDNQLELTYEVRDYWGSEHVLPRTTILKSAGKQGDQFIYEGRIDLSKAPLEIGRYYEVHASIPGSDALTEPFRNHTSLAILPEAVTRKYKPEEIPFTSRNWDNRISEYIRLTDRLGIRICGLWGGWSDTAPYKPDAPGLKLCRELGMGWLSNTPIATIERGESKYSDEALRQGVRNFLKSYGDERPLIINLGNEPHGKGDVVLRNVAAYKVVYEEIKKIDPSIPVVATSVEPNEEYFKAGYGKWCDAYDFHIYETAPNVRRTMEAYRSLMKKYGVEKPLWSTELGLNSQGQPRHTVAVEVFKKLSSFFAAGGQNVSWFGLLYPDAEGKLHGSSGDSHNVFDCRFNRYSPRLDAIAYYNIVNAISIKKFVEEKSYAGGTSALLFRDRDDKCLQVVWNEEVEEDVFLPLPGVGKVEVIRIDGRRTSLDAAQKGISLRITNDPMLVLYEGNTPLAAKLGAAQAKLISPPAELKRGEKVDFRLTGNANVIAPAFWTVQKSGERSTLTPPKSSAVREAEVILRLPVKRGELIYRIPIK